MDATKISIENFQEAIAVSAQALPILAQKPKDSLIRFAFCGVEKINKTVAGILPLYSQLEENRDLEFPIGILLRSLMMDNMMVQKIHFTILDYVSKNPNWDKEGLTKEVRDLCYKFVSDGTDSLIKDVYDLPHLTEADKDDMAKKFAMQFPDAFDFPAGKPKLKSGFKFQIKNLFLQSDHQDLVSRKDAYQLYTFYSKYDHLSHWTSAATEIPFERRKHKIDLATPIIFMQLRNLLVLAYDFDPSFKELEPLLDRVQAFLHQQYDQPVADQANNKQSATPPPL